MSHHGPLRAVVLLACASMLALPALATITNPGRWSNAVRWRDPATGDTLKETAVTMAVLPMPDASGQTRARIIWWRDDHTHDDPHPAWATIAGGLLEWRPPNDAALATGAFPDTAHGSGELWPRRFPSPGYNFFCSGLAMLDADAVGGGQLLALGGTEEAENGSRKVRLYNASTNTWIAPPDSLADGRWYPSGVTLAGGTGAAGRVLVLSGTRYGEKWLFGGGADADSQMYIDPVAHDPATSWNHVVLPEQATRYAAHGGDYRPRPVPRRGHSATWEIGGMLAYYGGMSLENNALLSDCWTLRYQDSPGSAQEQYRYELRNPVDPLLSPGPLAYHTSFVVGLGGLARVRETLVLVGGQRFATGTGVARNQVYAGRLIDNGATIQWTLLNRTADSEILPPRFGHASFWEPNLKRLFVYGGRPDLGATPSDPDVYALEFVPIGTGDLDDDLDSTEVRWKKCVVQNPTEAPSPRAFMAADRIDRDFRVSEGVVKGTKALAIYGGLTASGATSDELFILWPVSADTVRWQAPAQVGSHPAIQYGAAAATNGNREFWVLGGKTAAGAALNTMNSAAMHCDPCGTSADTAYWTAQPSASQAVWGHSFKATQADVASRTTELYDPASLTFETIAGAHLRLDWYPQVFTVPGQPDQVVAVGPNEKTWKLTLSGPSSGAWSLVTDDATDFRGGSSVMYRPGKVLKCGTRDTDATDTAIGVSKTMDVTAPSPSWAVVDTMVARVNHNLVLLPDGKVLVTGGTGTKNNQDNLRPKHRPEIWDPATGQWEGGDGVGVQLDTSRVTRGYHSTAVLLPDGRVLCGGGNAFERREARGAAWEFDQFKMDLYSPPYLFNADGTAAPRPSLLAVPRNVAFGEEFVVQVGNSDVAASMCLIRPAATTHGYDENQRFVPLTIAAAEGGFFSGPRYYKARLPLDPASVPPGEYMLFVLNSAGTPSIARWVHVGPTNGRTGQPTQVTDLHRVCSGVDGEVHLSWTAPGTDAGDPIPTHAVQYQLERVRTSPAPPVTDVFSTGLPSPGEPLVGADEFTDTGRAIGHTYAYRVRSKSAASPTGNWSDWSNSISHYVLANEECGGSGGGGGGGGYYEGDFSRHGDMRFSATYRNPGGTAPDSTYLENTLLPNVGLNVTKRDRIRLPFGPRWTESGARVRLSRAGSRSTHFDAVRLLAVEYAEGEGAFLAGGELVGGVTHDPFRVTHADGRDLTELFVSGGAFEGRVGDTLYADLGVDGPGSLVLTTSRALLVRAPDRTGIDLASEVGGEWTDIGHHDVRAHASDEVFAAPNARRVRLAFRGPHRLEGLGRFTTGAPLTVTAHEPAAAEHSRLGEVTAAFAAEGEGTTLASGDNLLADFAASPAPDGTRREWYLEVTGAHMEGGGGVSAAKLTSLTAPPASFALLRNRPNPFTGTTTLGFDVPRRTHVRLEVFDITGRRVAMLANREYEPGRFTLDWDGRTSGGTRAAAGVYLYRMTAGAFREQRHMVLVR